jgi:transcriptional regulator with XRE-family HTH domain
MGANQQMITLRTKKIGLLIYDARLASHMEAEACAKAMGVSVEEYQKIETGQHAPSLPQLEALAYYLNLPLEHFWGQKSLSNQPGKQPTPHLEQVLALRSRIMAITVKMLRDEANFSLAQLSNATEIDEATLKAYESFETPIPIPQLEVIAKALGKQIENFFDTNGPIGAWRAEQQIIQEFLELSAEMQEFVCKPVNKPYLELAMRLSVLSVEKLRTIAEGLLEITY